MGFGVSSLEMQGPGFQAEGNSGRAKACVVPAFSEDGSDNSSRL